MGNTEKRIEELGYVLPELPAAVGAYVPALMLEGNLMYLSGQTAKKDGVPIYVGKVGKEISCEDAYKAAQHCALALIAVTKSFLGDLGRVKQIVKVNGYVNADPSFQAHPKVINGASELLEAIFEERGKHTRTSIGAGSLPDNASVEVEMIIQYV